MEEGLPEEVLSHELCHIHHYHSVDRIVVELILLIQWWNPFAHLLIRSLKENHEFTADDYALRSKGRLNALIDQILSYSTRANSNQLFQIGFAHHAVVKRIKMIKKEKIKLLPSMAILSLSLIFFIAVSCTDSSDTLDEAMSSDESTFTILTERGSSYIYPVALLELFKSGELLSLIHI